MAPANQSGEWFHVAAPTVKNRGLRPRLDSTPLALPKDAEMGADQFEFRQRLQ